MGVVFGKDTSKTTVIIAVLVLVLILNIMMVMINWYSYEIIK